MRRNWPCRKWSERRGRGKVQVGWRRGEGPVVVRLTVVERARARADVREGNGRLPVAVRWIMGPLLPGRDAGLCEIKRVASRVMTPRPIGPIGVSPSQLSPPRQEQTILTTRRSEDMAAGISFSSFTFICCSSPLERTNIPPPSSSSSTPPRRTRSISARLTLSVQSSLGASRAQPQL